MGDGRPQLLCDNPSPSNYLPGWRVLKRKKLLEGRICRPSPPGSFLRHAAFQDP